VFSACDPPTVPPPAPPAFVEVAAEVGLADRPDGRVALADLNGDGRPDVIVSRRHVLLNTPDAAAPRGFRFVSAPETLPDLGATAVTAFADFDNDGRVDAVMVRDMDPALRDAPGFGNDATAQNAPAVFCRGKGDGTFEKPVRIAVLGPAHTAALAVGDMDGDGRLDLYRGNWYRKYGDALDATPGDLLVQAGGEPFPACLRREVLPEDVHPFTEEKDEGGRPTYGAVIAALAAPDRAAGPAQIAQLNYGRRWNRLYARIGGEWQDVAPACAFDGDADRSGKYPAWLAERAATDKRFDRPDEKPFRANGNTFDMSVGDVNGDGLMDCFVAEIAHAWAGPSSDRSRFLVAERAETPLGVRFVTPAWASVDRVPAGDGPESRSWNQGDLFCELVDVDNDGRLDLVLASGDYPDAPPRDQRLRIFRQRAEPGPDGRLFEDATLASGVDLPGAAQLAVGDLDLDGDVDIVCGQSFTRFTPEMIAAAGGTPRLRVFLNQAADRGARGCTLVLRGDPAQRVNRDAIGARVTATTPGADGAPPRVQVARVAGPGGHSGKQRALQVHFGGVTDATTFALPPGVAVQAKGGR
jgi:hypothetical protein